MKTTCVLFYWNPHLNAEGYVLQITDTQNDDLVYSDTLAINSCIVEKVLSWDRCYIWRANPIIENEICFVDEYHRFSTDVCPDIEDFNIEIFDSAAVEKGIVLFSPITKGCIYGFDETGDLVWYHQRRGNFMDIELRPDGNFLFLHNSTPKEMTIYGEIIWNAELNMFHHEIEPVCNGNFFSWRQTNRLLESPLDEEIEHYWTGDVLLELDCNLDTLFFWNSFDHISTNYFDQNYLEQSPPGGLFDWTHANTAHLLPDGESILISFRHLNSVMKIAYPEGDIIWAMGNRYPDGCNSFGHNVNFSHQHDPELLDNGNILIFDNHNLGPEDSSRAIEVSIDLDRTPVAQIEHEVWLDVFVPAAGDVDYLTNSNLLFCASASGIYEYSYTGEKLWHLNLRDNRGIYRVQKVPHLYPLAYTLEGPEPGTRIPDGDSYIQFEITNLGWVDQTFAYQIRDEYGCFEVGHGQVMVPSESSVTRTIHGQISENIREDNITIIVHPLLNPDLLEVWETNVVIDSALNSSNEVFPLAPDFPQMNISPNPFNRQIELKFTVHEVGNASINIFDSSGRFVVQICDEKFSAGTHKFSWDGSNQNGKSISPGCYFVRVQIHGKTSCRKITYLR